jgi:glutamyl-tRNA reductase
MKIAVVGLNHKTADVELREKLAFNGPKLEEGLRSIKDIPGIKEAAILSTCNRVEIYLTVEDLQQAFSSLKDFLVQFFDLRRDSLDKALYLHEEMMAVKHIFRVASSLDSMVLGEPQILGQLKDAFDFALEKKTTGALLNRLLKKSISVAKRVRTETRIASSAVSISFAAVELAKKIFTDLSGKSFMLLGAGEMAELAAKHMMNNGVQEIVVANRTYERGCELAHEFNGKAIRFEDFPERLINTDILICSTGAPVFVLLKEHMQKAMKARKQKPVFLIDISVPRNIDPAINDMDNVYLYNVDDLNDVVDTNKQERQKEAEKAEEIVEEEIETFKKWMSTLDSVPAVVALREKAEAIRKDELERFLNRFPELGEKERKAIEGLSSAIMNKLIHGPTIALKDDAEDKDVMIAVIKRLYGLNGDDDEKK